MEWFIYAFLAAISVSIVSTFNKKILFHEHVIEFGASRGIMLIFFSMFLIPFVTFKMPWQVYLFIYFVSLLLSTGIIYVMKSLKRGEVSSVIPLMNISPLFLLIIAFFVLGEKITPRQYFGVFLLILGTYALQIGVSNKGLLEPIKDFLKSKVIHYLMFSLVIFSITATFDKMIITKYTDHITYLFILTVFQAINFILLDLYKFGKADIKKNLKKDFKLLFFDAGILMGANLAYFTAVASPTAQISLIIPIKRTSALFTTIIGGKLFHEKNLLIKVLSCIIMIWGAVFILL